MDKAELDVLIADASKKINGDISWRKDGDHYPSVFFEMDLENSSGTPMIVKGCYNPVASKTCFSLIPQGEHRAYGLDVGRAHKSFGEVHKHQLKEVYEPDDITSSQRDPTELWEEFCAETNIIHEGTMSPPPPFQMEML